MCVNARWGFVLGFVRLLSGFLFSPLSLLLFLLILTPEEAGAVKCFYFAPLSLSHTFASCSICSARCEQERLLVLLKEVVCVFHTEIFSKNSGTWWSLQYSAKLCMCKHTWIYRKNRVCALTSLKVNMWQHSLNSLGQLSCHWFKE